MMKTYAPGVKPKEMSAEEKLEKQLAAAARGLLAALRAMREATTTEDRKHFATRAKRFKAYLERLGKNK